MAGATVLETGVSAIAAVVVAVGAVVVVAAEDQMGSGSTPARGLVATRITPGLVATRGLLVGVPQRA